MADYDPEQAAKLKHLGALAQQTANAIHTLDGMKFGSVRTVDGKLNFYASTDGTGTVLKSIDLPAEKFLDLLQSGVANNFAWSAATYPNSTNPNLDGKPVLVLALKIEEGGTTTIAYSFASLEGLIDVYTARDASITIPAGGNSIGVNVSPDADNNLSITNNGLTATAKVNGAVEDNIAVFGPSGVIRDSGFTFASDSAVAACINPYFATLFGGNGGLLIFSFFTAGGIRSRPFVF